MSMVTRFVFLFFLIVSLPNKVGRIDFKSNASAQENKSSGAHVGEAKEFVEELKDSGILKEEYSDFLDGQTENIKKEDWQKVKQIMNKTDRSLASIKEESAVEEVNIPKNQSSSIKNRPTKELRQKVNQVENIISPF